MQLTPEVMEPAFAEDSLAYKLRHETKAQQRQVKFLYGSHESQKKMCAVHQEVLDALNDAFMQGLEAAKKR